MVIIIYIKNIIKINTDWDTLGDWVLITNKKPFRDTSTENKQAHRQQWLESHGHAGTRQKRNCNFSSASNAFPI